LPMAEEIPLSFFFFFFGAPFLPPFSCDLLLRASTFSFIRELPLFFSPCDDVGTTFLGLCPGAGRAPPFHPRKPPLSLFPSLADGSPFWWVHRQKRFSRRGHSLPPPYGVDPFAPGRPLPLRPFLSLSLSRWRRSPFFFRRFGRGPGAFFPAPTRGPASLFLFSADPSLLRLTLIRRGANASLRPFLPFFLRPTETPRRGISGKDPS